MHVPLILVLFAYIVLLFVMERSILRVLWVLLCVLCAGKASLITIGGLVVGALVGGLVESWLRVDIVPVLGVGSPAIVVSEFVLFSLWFSSLYLR